MSWGWHFHLDGDLSKTRTTTHQWWRKVKWSEAESWNTPPPTIKTQAWDGAEVGEVWVNSANIAPQGRGGGGGMTMCLCRGSRSVGSLLLIMLRCHLGSCDYLTPIVAAACRPSSHGKCSPSLRPLLVRLDISPPHSCLSVLVACRQSGVRFLTTDLAIVNLSALSFCV